jgi:CheY-like chemotaxis protein
MDISHIVAAIGGSGGIGLSAWTFFKERIKERDLRAEREAFKKQIKEAEERAAEAVKREVDSLKERVKKLEKDHSDCEQLLRAEIRRSAQKALEPRRADAPIPDQIPTPEEDWYANTGARIMWDEETQKVIREAKEEQRKSSSSKLAAVKPPRPAPKEDLRPRAIIIDDEVDFAEGMARHLAKIVPGGWKVELMSDARAGRVVLVMDSRVKFAIVDYLMPRFDGEAVITETLKARPELKGKIIVMSGWTLPPDVAHHLFDELHCLWLEKPIDPEKLQALVWQAIEAPTS